MWVSLYFCTGNILAGKKAGNPATAGTFSCLWYTYLQLDFWLHNYIVFSEVQCSAIIHVLIMFWFQFPRPGNSPNWGMRFLHLCSSNMTNYLDALLKLPQWLPLKIHILKPACHVKYGCIIGSQGARGFSFGGIWGGPLKG